MANPSSGKKSFVLYDDFHPQLDMMTAEQAGHLLKAIFAYRNESEYLIDDQIVNFALKGIVSQLDRDTAKYDAICVKRSAAGIEGAKQKLAKRGKRKHKVAKEADSDTVSDSDTVKGNIKNILDGLSPSRMELVSEWMKYKAEKNQTYKPTGLKALVKKLDQYSDQTVKESIAQAVSNNWAGLFPEKVTTTQTRPSNQVTHSTNKQDFLPS